ncbi:hypothetical protein T4D_10543 [Trichinella pseudospiralis]|uniref:Uncharacterized protein n=1 Tax=Trichinella pseudospiralis TaxID=6337 RepID=A0A0V1FFE4_TRIPS|nr:hypothetical protein T4D_10543 [Trichinella pseudospiralis]
MISAMSFNSMTALCKNSAAYRHSELQRTWTELTEFFLQKTKRKKPIATVRRIGHEDRMRGTVAEVEEGYILIVCCFVVAMPSLNREAERRGKAAANTGPSPNSEGRANSLAEQMDELARYRINNITVKSV